MLRSKAAAALMRLKEIDKKYSVQRQATKGTSSNAGTESNPVSPTSISTPSDVRETTKNIKEKFLKTKINVSIPNVQVEGDGYLLRKENESGNSSSGSSKYRNDSKKVEGVDSGFGLKVSGKGNEKILQKSRDLDVLFLNLISGETVPKDTSDVPSKISDNSIVESLHSLSSVKEGADKSNSTNRKNYIEENEGDSNSNFETTINEILKSSEERSEILSGYLGPIEGENKSVSNRSSGREISEMRYESDTFEEASTSTILTKSNLEREEQIQTPLVAEENPEAAAILMASGIKQVEIVTHKRIETHRRNEKCEGDKQIIELVAPKILQNTSECEIGLDEELSNYVKTIENIDDPEELTPVCLLKSPKRATSPTKKFGRKIKNYVKSSKENADDCKGSIEPSSLLSNKKEEKLSNMTSGSRKKDADLLRVDIEEERNRVSERGINSSAEEQVESFSSEDLLQEIPKKYEDATSTLRKLNRDALNAISKRRRISEARRKAIICKAENRRNGGHCVRLYVTDSEVFANINEEENDTASRGNIKTCKSSHNENRIGSKKSKTKSVKSSKIRSTMNHSKPEEKHSRFECKHAYHIRKQVAALKLQQEREDLRRYMHDLEFSGAKFGCGEFLAKTAKTMALKPLEFPKVAAFVNSDEDDMKLNIAGEITVLQERVSAIRQWLKDQYILYRDYTALAQTLNAKYVPASLEDAKKTIRHLQRDR